MSKRTEPAERKLRSQLNVAASPELREKIVIAAQEARRSIGRELEYRLKNSFERDEVFALLLGGTANGRFAQNLAFAARDADQDWASDPKKEAELIKQIEKVVRAEGKARRAE
jgi:hypothetical protein